MTTESPKIKLYTNHSCPCKSPHSQFLHVKRHVSTNDTRQGAHRAHIALTELKVPYDEEIIDLSVPRTQEYLQVNPRGLVPSLSYNGEIITESAIVANFLADEFPSTLVPKSTDTNGALIRARIAFFVDTYFSKAGGHFFKSMAGKTEEERSAATTDYVNAIVKEVEPLLADAAPFFGGSENLTLAEVSHLKRSSSYV